MSSYLDSKSFNCFFISFFDASPRVELDTANLTARLIALSAFILVLPSEENADASRFSHLIAGMESNYVRSDTKV